MAIHKSVSDPLYDIEIDDKCKIGIIEVCEV